MEELVQQFESPVVYRDGQTYTAFVRGRMRSDRRWEAWLEFRRDRDGRIFHTPIETTQPDRERVLYWATALGTAYFEGAIDRAMRQWSGAEEPVRRANGEATPLDPLVRAARLAGIQSEIIDVFRAFASPRLLTRQLFDALDHAHADVVRALEDLEKQQRTVVRRTEEGSDWVFLTEEGLAQAGLSRLPHDHGRVEIDPTGRH